MPLTSDFGWFCDFSELLGKFVRSFSTKHFEGRIICVHLNPNETEKQKPLNLKYANASYQLLLVLLTLRYELIFEANFIK